MDQILEGAAWAWEANHPAQELEIGRWTLKARQQRYTGAQ